jgi:hypothetical protein
MMRHARHRRPVLAWLISASVCVLASSASAAPAVRVGLSGEAPFSAAELDAAVRARVPVATEGKVADVTVLDIGKDATLVIVTSSGPHSVRVRAGEKSQVVDVGDRTGTSAARIVALVIADLSAEEMTLPTAALPPTPSRPRISKPAPAPITATGPAVGSYHSQSSLRIAATAGASKGASADEPLCFRSDVDVSRPLVGRLLTGGSLGLVLIPRRNRGRPDDLSYTAAMVNVWAGLRIRTLELGMGPFVSPYALGGDVENYGVLAGASGLVRLVTPLSTRFRLVVAARANAYLNRIHVTWPGMGGFATPRYELAFSAGVAWDRTP